MKSLLFSLFVLCTCVPAQMEAAMEPIITRTFIQDNALEITLANLEQELTRIELRSLDGEQRMFSDLIKNHNGYSVSLCLNELPEGRYVLSVKKGDTLRRQVILKTDEGVMCSEWK